MISSMTGYAAATRELPIASLAAEVKSVNSRFLDVQFRLPDELRPVEPALRELIQTRVGRGKVECRVSVTPPVSAGPRISVNEGLLLELAEVSRRVRAAVPDARPLSVGEVLNWPGVLGDDRSAALRDACVTLVHEALDDFSASRSREGGKLAQRRLHRAKLVGEPELDVEEAAVDALHFGRERRDRQLPGCHRVAGHAGDHGSDRRRLIMPAEIWKTPL